MDEENNNYFIHARPDRQI